MALVLQEDLAVTGWLINQELEVAVYPNAKRQVAGI